MSITPLNKATHKMINHFIATHPDLKILELIVPDINGIARGKWSKPEAIKKAFDLQLRFPFSVYSSDIWGEGAKHSGLVLSAGDQDGIGTPVPSTLQPIFWHQHPAAQLMLGITYEDGIPFYGDPRHVLQRILDLYEDMQLRPVVALELEFYLFRKDQLKHDIPKAQRLGGKTELYSLSELQALEPLLIDIQQNLESQDIPADTFVKENALGQYEINLKHSSDAMRNADQTFLFKRTIKACAQKHQMIASFMAKPIGNQPGNGMHMHLSLLDKHGTNIFQKENEQPNSAFGHAIAGILASAQDTVGLLAPHANSYRRLCSNTLAPTTLSWGWENRTAALRLPLADEKNQRIEHRVAGADANPYLVMAAILAGVHHGLTTKPKLSKATVGNAYAQHDSTLSMSWQEAIKRTVHSKFIQTYFEPQFCNLYNAIKMQEFKRFNATITDFEYYSYLTNS